MLNVNPQVRIHALALDQPLKGLSLEPESEGRVDEYDIERAVRLLQPLQGIGMVHRHDLGPGPARDRACQAAGDGPVLFDEHDLGRAARSGFESQRAGAGEQIDAACADHARTQPVEQRLARSIAGGPQPGTVGDVQLAPTPLPSNDANPAGHGDSISCCSKSRKIRCLEPRKPKPEP